MNSRNLKNQFKIAALVSAFFVVSCQKIEEELPPDGRPVSATAIQDEFSKVEKNVNPIGAKVGDSLSLLLNMSVENSENVQSFAALQRVVLERNTIDKGIEYKIQNVDYSIDKDNVAKEVRNEICTLSLTSSAITYVCPSDRKTSSSVDSPQLQWESSKIQLSQMLKEKIAAKADGEDDSDRVVDRRYYNLKTVTETAEPPKAVRERANCSGLSPCQIQLHHLQFTELERYASGKTRRILWDYALTSDLMYLGTEGIQYKTCASESVESQGRPVLIKQCLFVYDLIKN
ncbi:MAG: hypothetical protein GW917_01580 [Bdellovibrionales bacterium]|nr:hypothetical protein [Bdellovibrionales bacterium]